MKGYPERSKLAVTVLLADRFNMIVTVAPCFHSRLSEKWKKAVFGAKMPQIRVFQTVQRFFFAQLSQWKQLKDIQQDIYRIYGYALTVKRMKWWIMRRKYGKEPGTEKNIHYWSIQW